MKAIRTYFKGLNLSVLPEKAKSFIEKEISEDVDLDLLDENDEDFVAVKEQIESEYPDAIVKEPIEIPVEDEITIKLRKEISDLEELIEMEEDEILISKFKKEIEDLKDLI